MQSKFLFFLYLLLILLLVALPLNSTNAFLSNTYLVEIRLDYLSHVILFSPFLFLHRSSYQLAFWQLFLAGISFSSFAEGLQFLLPYRFFNINDLLANVIGILSGTILLLPPISKFLFRFLSLRR